MDVSRIKAQRKNTTNPKTEKKMYGRKSRLYPVLALSTKDLWR
jgi:hypothetical protein